jgi:hypothetical protein
MQRDKAKIEASLKSKGFMESHSDHNRLIFHTQSGFKSAIMTKTSWSPKVKSLGDGLLGAMARQCRLSKADFIQLVDCPIDYAAYEALLSDKGLL